MPARSTDAIRWNIKVSRETDLALRSLLQSDKRGELSRFVEQAVLNEVFHRTIADIQTRNRSAEPDLIEVEIEAAVREARAELRNEARRV